MYETTDLPECEQTSDFYDEENEVVERLQISPNDAFNKFKDKKLEGVKVDFSDRISRKTRTGYDVGNWELVAQGENETVLQKYHRLQCEMKELVEEISKIKATNKGDSISDTVSSEKVEESLKKLADLRLEETLGSEIISSITDPQGAQLKCEVSV